MAADGIAVNGSPPRVQADSGGSSCETLIGLEGIHCAACVQRAQRFLAGKVESCEIDLATRTAAIRHDPQRLTVPQLLAALDAAGFQPHRLAADESEDEAETDARARRMGLARIGVAVFGSMQVMMFAWPGYFEGVDDPGLAALLRWAQLLIATPTVFWAGWPFFANAVRSLAGRTLTMDVPVAISMAIAWAASALRTVEGEGLLYFDAATMFVALLLMGRYLEAATRAKAGARLRQLADSTPVVAQRLSGDAVQTVPVLQLRPGDRVRVLPGEALPVDGRLESAAELDEALISGESRPMLRSAGELALAGSLNLTRQALVLVAEATGDGTRIAGILRLLQRAAARKPRVQKLADRVAGHFTLAVLLLAAAGGIYASREGLDAAIGVVIAMLVASCPCALSLAVPAALAAATSRLAARGVLVARADRLLRLAEVDTVLIDKTGTLTEARLSLQRSVTLRGASETAVRRIAAALEAGLPHPIAQALAAGSSGLAATDLKVEAGRGVSGVVDGRRYRLGAAREEVTALDAALTWVTLFDESGALAHFGLSAPLRPEAAAQIHALQSRGLHVELLTGDGPEAAARIAELTGINDLAARQTPEDKLARLRALQAAGHVVLAVGDGLNDAPFLAAADVSAAMPKGSAATQARADLVLVSDRLDGLGLAHDVGRQARLRVRQNLLWAAVYNLAVLPLAFFGEIQPWLAAAGMSLSSLLVVGNALRLRLPEQN